MKVQLLLAWGHRAQMSNTRSKSMELQSRAALHWTEAEATAAEPQDTAASAASPSPRLLHPSAGEDRGPHSSWRKEICSSAASLPFCPDLHCQGNSLVLLFPVLSSDLFETSGKTPWSRRVMGICHCERTAASLSRCCVWREEGGQLEANSSSACSQQCLLLWESSIPARFPGSRACTAGPRWDGSLSP